MVPTSCKPLQSADRYCGDLPFEWQKIGESKDSKVRLWTRGSNSGKENSRLQRAALAYCTQMRIIKSSECSPNTNRQSNDWLYCRIYVAQLPPELGDAFGYCDAARGRRPEIRLANSRAKDCDWLAHAAIINLWKEYRLQVKWSYRILPLVDWWMCPQGITKRCCWIYDMYRSWNYTKTKCWCVSSENFLLLQRMVRYRLILSCEV
jgi:hypothetical protein